MVKLITGSKAQFLQELNSYVNQTIKVVHFSRSSSTYTAVIELSTETPTTTKKFDIVEGWTEVISRVNQFESVESIFRLSSILVFLVRGDTTITMMMSEA